MTTFASSAFSIVGSRSEMDQLIASSSSPSPPSSVAVNVTALSKPLPSLPLFFVSLLAGMTGWYLPKYMLPSEEVIHAREIPYQTTRDGDVILAFDYNLPLVDPPTIPSSLLIKSSVWVPAMTIVMFACLAQHCNAANNKNARNNNCSRKLHNIHAGLCALFVAIGSSEGLTQILKIIVLRRRPNFYHLCEFNTTTKLCTATFHRVLEAQLSFPSGHTSLSFSGMTILVWFLLGQVHYRTSSHNKGLYLLCFFPWIYACFVGISRIVDYWHHPSDVLAGFLLGTTCSTIAYHLWYPPVLSRDAGIPYSYNTSSKDVKKLPSFYE